jgi:hypothetical protein
LLWIYLAYYCQTVTVNAMKLSNICFGLLSAAVCGAATEGIPLSINNYLIFIANSPNEEPLYAVTLYPNEDEQGLVPQENRNGWVNPEDLTPVPQCIVQQDPSAWLNTLTQCTGKQCTRHFGVICTRHQWLTQLSCLSTGFSSDVIGHYLPYCGRSILAKAQLYRWVHGITGRTWLVNVGDANNVQNLSPASLAGGYAAVDAIHHAPTCLTSWVSDLSTEPFQHVLASCSFTDTTQRTGRIDRPWEYREDIHSMVSLGFETVGYDLAAGRIGNGNYFDKECFCGAFTIDPERKSCSGPGNLDWTKQWLWMIVTCGPRSLPDNLTQSLKNTGFAYVPVEDWRWPKCVMDMPKQITELVHTCATDACGLDSSGYCDLKRTVDRACFCRSIDYDSCGGSCKRFETRIDYVKWLHGLCGEIQDWQGLPDNWRRLVIPVTLDLLPWQWTIAPINDTHMEGGECPTHEWKLGSLVLINVATFLAVGIPRIAPSFLQPPPTSTWAFRGFLIAGLHLLANFMNAFLVQQSLGYDDIPFIQLVLLWCSMPRLAWWKFLRIGLQPFDAINFTAATSWLFAEMLLQASSAYYMIFTVVYGLQHNFYFGSFGGAERQQAAKLMYTGALLWLVVMSVASIWAIRAARKANRVTAVNINDPPKPTISNIEPKLIAVLDDFFTWLGEILTHRWGDKKNTMVETSTLLGNSAITPTTTYGTLSILAQEDGNLQQRLAKQYAGTALVMFLVWIAQWLFWAGFISLASKEYVDVYISTTFIQLTQIRYCPPQLQLLTAIWIVSTLLSTTIPAT